MPAKLVGIIENYIPSINTVTGNWQVWDPRKQKYMDTGIPAQGENGQYCYPTFSLEENGDLYVSYTWLDKGEVPENNGE